MLAACAACTFPAPSYAQDRWTGADKAQHFTYSAMAGVVAQAVVPNPWAAVVLASMPGLLRETAASSTGFSRKDMAWNVIGASAGVAGGRFMAAKAGDRVQLTYTWDFK